MSDTTLLQTEKADLSTELGSKEVVNLPLNQFRNYQALLNLSPGATPAQFQNAEIDTPGRALRTSVNGMQRNSNAFRIDGAVSVNIWLPHHVGYVNSAETIDTVNISTNNFDADQGMAAGAAVTVVTKSGTNELHGSAFFLRTQDEFNANTFANNANDLRQAATCRTASTAARSAGRSCGTSCSSSAPGSATRAAAASTAPTSRPRPGCARATSARSPRRIRPSASTTRTRAARAASGVISSRTSRSRRTCSTRPRRRCSPTGRCPTPRSTSTATGSSTTS